MTPAQHREQRDLLAFQSDFLAAPSRVAESCVETTRAPGAGPAATGYGRCTWPERRVRAIGVQQQAKLATPRSRPSVSPTSTVRTAFVLFRPRVSLLCN